MAAPRIQIVDLPEQLTPVATDLLVVQDGGVTKKMTLDKASIGVSNALTAHITDTSAAHVAASIDATPNTAPMSGTTVQSQLAQAASALAAATTAAALKADKTTTITTTAPLAGGGDLSANRTLTVDTFSASTTGVVPASGGGSTNYLRADGTWNAPAGGGGGGITTDQAIDAVQAAMTATAPVVVTHDSPTQTIKLSISDFTASTRGAVPNPTSSTGRFLKDDGTWGTPAAGGAVTAQTIEAVAGTTYTVVTADANKIKRLAAIATITLPSAGPGVGERVDFVCVGGPATFTLGGGATWDVNPTPSAVARAIGSMVTAVKMTATAWALTGDLA